MNIHTTVKTMLAVLLLTCCLCWQPELIASNNPPSSTPITVHTQMVIYSIDNFDAADNSFLMHAHLTERWHDPTLVSHSSKANVQYYTGSHSLQDRLSKIWSPQLFIEHTSSPTQVSQQSLIIYPSGNVELKQMLHAQVHEPFKIERIPFDEHNLPITLTSSAWNTQQMILSPPKIIMRKLFDLESSGWLVKSLNYQVKNISQPYSSHTFSTVHIVLHIQRDHSFFMIRYILPNLIIVALSWATFFMKTERIHLASGCLVVIVAYQIFMTTRIPHVGYLTPLDYFFIWSAICIISVIIRAAADIHRQHRHLPRSKLAKIQYYAIPAIYLIGYAIIFLSARLAN